MSQQAHLSFGTMLLHLIQDSAKNASQQKRWAPAGVTNAPPTNSKALVSAPMTKHKQKTTLCLHSRISTVGLGILLLCTRSLTFIIWQRGQTRNGLLITYIQCHSGTTMLLVIWLLCYLLYQRRKYTWSGMPLSC